MSEIQTFVYIHTYMVFRNIRCLKSEQKCPVFRHCTKVSETDHFWGVRKPVLFHFRTSNVHQGCAMNTPKSYLELNTLFQWTLCRCSHFPLPSDVSSIGSESQPHTSPDRWVCNSLWSQHQSVKEPLVLSLESKKRRFHL